MSRSRRLGATFLGLAVLLVAAPATAAPAAPGPAEPAAAAVDGRVLVTWQPWATEQDRQQVRGRHGLATQEVVGALDLEALRIPAHTPQHVADRLADERAVAIAEPDYVLDRAATDDPGFDDLWGLHNTGQDLGVADVDVDAPEAWQHTTGSDVVVAVIDTGMDVRHPDLAGNAWTNPGEIAGNGVDDDGNGYVDDVHGWDFKNDDASVYDSSAEDGHGTHVGGTIAAVGDNGIGVVGVAPGVKVMPLKFIGAEGTSGSSLDAVQAVEYAVDNGASVINASWGGEEGGDTLKNAIARATGIAFVAAAGNGSLDIDSSPRYPAAWARDSHGVDNVLSVASVTRQGALSGFSNHGQSSVDVGAPGSSIVSTLPGSKYGYQSGTSMASPHAAGVAALVASRHPGLTGAEIVDAVKQAAEPLGDLDGITTTGGLVNAASAVLLADADATATPDDETDGQDPDPVDEPEADETDADEPETDPVDEPDEPETDEPDSDPATACPSDSVPASGFTDLSDGVHTDAIACVAWWGVANGVTAERFDPTGVVTRGQMAAFVARSIRQAGVSLPAGEDAFGDDDGSIFADDIDALAAAGIVRGVGDDRYAPQRQVTRAEMAAFLVRADAHILGTELVGTEDAFSDDDGGVLEEAINAAFEGGLVQGTGDDTYAPSRSVVRAEMATFLSRLLDRAVVLGDARTPA